MTLITNNGTIPTGLRQGLRREIRPVEKSPIWTSQEEVIRAGARQMLQTAIEMEVFDFVSQSSKKEYGRSVVVKNGYLPEREILTGIGPIKIKQPRVDDRKARTKKEGLMFTSKILPKYLRKIPSI